MEGWIKLHRKIVDNPYYFSEAFTRSQAWIDLLILANHKDNFYYIRGVKVEVKRGQIGHSLENLAKRFRWSRGKAERFINELETSKQIVRQKNNVTTLFSIVNYNEYQQDSKADSNPNSKADGNQTVTQTVKQTDINKNVNNVKNEKNINKLPETSSGEVENNLFPTEKKTASTESINAKPKKEKKVVDQELKSDLRDIFNEHYIEKFKTKYSWAAVDHISIAKLIGNIRFKISEVMPGLEGEDLTQQIILSFTHLIKEIKDPWLLNNYTLPIINQKFNIIYQQIKNPNQHATAKQRNQQGASEAAEFIKQFEQSTGIKI